MSDIPSPAYVIDLAGLRANCKILADIRQRSGTRIVHALKAFSLPQAFPTMTPYLDGCCASGPWETRLAYEEFGGAILTSAPSYADKDIPELLELATHLDFNSVSQWQRFRGQVMNHPRFQSGELRYGLRINPRCSTGPTPLYDPCSPGSRLGAPSELLENADLDGITGLHFHTLCEQPLADLEKTLQAVEEQFGKLLRSPQITSLNLGGGHWITKPDYDRERLITLINDLRKNYQLEEIWLEPGEAAVIDCGTLVATVLDTFQNGEITVAILDISATAHMPDILEMPYRPAICTESGETAGTDGEFPYTYRLGGSSCLAGDVIGDYSFSRALEVGDRLHFQDMAQYTMVKTTFFNGVQHPAFVLKHEDGTHEMIRKFTYPDFKSRIS